MENESKLARNEGNTDNKLTLKERARLAKDITKDTLLPLSWDPIPNYSNRRRAMMRINRVRVGYSMHTVFAILGISQAIGGDFGGIIIAAVNGAAIAIDAKFSFGGSRKKLKRLLPHPIR